VATPSAYLMFGLSHGDTDQSIEDIDYAIYPSPYSSEACVYEGGANRGCIVPYVAGDRLRVGVEGGVVKYYRNGTVFYTSSVAPTYPLIADTTLNTAGGQVGSAAMAGELAETVDWIDVFAATASGYSSCVRAGRDGTREVRHRGLWCPGTGTRSTR